MRTSERIKLPDADEQELQRLARARNTPQKTVPRARIVLLSGESVDTSVFVAQLGTSVPTITRWRRRYQAAGVAGLLRDAARPGRKRRLTDEFVASAVQRTVQEKPQDATHWSTRSLAAALGVSPATVQRIWKRHGLKPPPRVASNSRATNVSALVSLSGDAPCRDIVGRRWCHQDVWALPTSS